MAIRVAIHGAAGRMGQRLVALAGADDHLQLVAALESPDHESIGRDAGMVAGAGELAVPIASALTDGADVVVDFSVPTASAMIVQQCRAQGVPLVVATTGFNTEQQALIDDAARTIAICQAPNMSLAVNLAMRLSQVAAGALRDHATGADVEILERHHRFKEDAPSGTALKFGEVIAHEMGQTHHQHGRAGRPGPRPHEEIGYHAIRVGDNPGEHTILFGLLGETIELRVAATSRDCYAQGALVAAKWLVGRAPGRYGMEHVLFERESDG